MIDIGKLKGTLLRLITTSGRRRHYMDSVGPSGIALLVKLNADSKLAESIYSQYLRIAVKSRASWRIGTSTTCRTQARGVCSYMEAEGWLNSKMGLAEFKKGLNPFN